MKANQVVVQITGVKNFPAFSEGVEKITRIKLLRLEKWKEKEKEDEKKKEEETETKKEEAKTPIFQAWAQCFILDFRLTLLQS